jgi:hypothetical protein
MPSFGSETGYPKMAWLFSARRFYFALPAFLAQASLQYFFLLSNVV